MKQTCQRGIVDLPCVGLCENAIVTHPSVVSERGAMEYRMTATGIRMTADELLRLPDNGMRRELIAGELHEMPAAGGEHGYVGNRAQIELGIYLRQHPEIGGSFFLSDTGYRLSRDPDTVRAPDISYVNEDKLPQARVRGFPELAPLCRGSRFAERHGH